VVQVASRLRSCRDSLTRAAQALRSMLRRLPRIVVTAAHGVRK